MDNERAGRERSAAAGKAARGRVPLDSHRDFEPGPGRDPVALLLEQAETRIPELADFGVSYADQTERDHAALAEAVASGRAQATRDV